MESEWFFNPYALAGSLRDNRFLADVFSPSPDSGR